MHPHHQGCGGHDLPGHVGRQARPRGAYSLRELPLGQPRPGDEDPDLGCPRPPVLNRRPACMCGQPLPPVVRWCRTGVLAETRRCCGTSVRWSLHDVGTRSSCPDGSDTSETSKGLFRMSWRTPDSISPSSPRMIFPGVTRFVSHPSLASIASRTRVETAAQYGSISSQIICCLSAVAAAARRIMRRLCS